MPNTSTTAQILRVTYIGMIANLFLCAFKFAGGFVGHSQAMVADAVHSLSDMTTDLAIIIGVRYWNKPADKEHPHGHKRLEIFVSLAIGVVLTAVALGILYNGITTLRERHSEPPALIALIAALVSIIVKEYLYRWTVAVGKRIKSVPLIANAWHHRSDALSSIPVALAVAGTQIDPSWAFLDHLGAVLVSLFILQAAYKIVTPGISKLMDAGASPKEIKTITEIAAAVNGVLKVNVVRTRYVGCSDLAVEIHIEVDGAITVAKGHEICDAVKDKLLESKLEITDVIVHLDPHAA